MLLCNYCKHCIIMKREIAKVQLGIVPPVAAELLVVDFQVRHRAARLTTPETLPRNQIRSRNVFVQSGEDGTVCIRELAQVTIGNLLGRSDPTGKMRNVMFV